MPDLLLAVLCGTTEANAHALESCRPGRRPLHGLSTKADFVTAHYRANKKRTLSMRAPIP
jgi:hypothetical protein